MQEIRLLTGEAYFKLFIRKIGHQTRGKRNVKDTNDMSYDDKHQHTNNSTQNATQEPVLYEPL